jgi:hypothetical protein
MEIFNRLTLMKVHTLLAAFILPAVTMFLVTGSLYTWGIKGGYETTVHKLHLETPLQRQLTELVAITEKELKARDIMMPSGQAKIKKIGTSFRLEWSGSTKDVILEPTSRPLVAKLKIKKTSWYRQFVQLHKAKGGSLFKVYAVILATSLFLLLITGFIMAWKTPKLRNLILVSTALGIAVFVVMVMAS